MLAGQPGQQEHLWPPEGLSWGIFSAQRLRRGLYGTRIPRGDAIPAQELAFLAGRACLQVRSHQLENASPPNSSFYLMDIDRELETVNISRKSFCPPPTVLCDVFPLLTAVPQHDAPTGSEQEDTVTTKATTAGLGQLCTCKATKGMGASSCRGR